MLDPTQTLLFAVVIILTFLMVFIGWQLFMILSEIKKILMKFNSVVDNTVILSDKFTNSILSLGGFADGLKAFLSLSRFFKKKVKKNGE